MTEIDTTAEIPSTAEIVMAEIPGESSPRGMKRALEEEEEEESVNESDGSEVEDEVEHRREFWGNCNKTYTIDHYGLDPEYYMSESDEETDELREFWVKYDKAVEETEGFDVPFYRGSKAPIKPLRAMFKYNPLVRRKQEYDDKCIFAINDFNSQNTTNYEFVKIEKANICISGSWIIYYFTFQAKDADADANIETDSVKTFQARVAEPIGEPRIVELCRIKKSFTPQGNEKSSSDSDADVKAVQ